MTKRHKLVVVVTDAQTPADRLGRPIEVLAQVPPPGELRRPGRRWDGSEQHGTGENRRDKL